ncbi:MAG TPA: lamin tail domain-containing protein, partial [Pirellulaceae bacterium]|nr:lamin tail domain-containing protein [Pirellulaceae bacterium]
MFTSWLSRRAPVTRSGQRQPRSFSQRYLRRTLQSERLEARQMLAADVIITEFMADNGGSVKDSFGDNSDWIEIYNRGDAAQNMSGWYLTDNASALTKWQFPAVTLQPQQSILVWATSRNLTTPAGELHTNFGLSKGGEFLGLVRPDGTTLVTQFAPKFPAQYTDVSYGQPTTQITEQLVSHASPTKVLVPTNGSLGTTWTAKNFVPDASWTAGASQGVGYDTDVTYGPYIGTNVPAMRNVNGSAYIRIPFNASSGSYNQLSLQVRYDDGFIAYINGQEVARRNAPVGAAWNSNATADRLDSVAVQYETINLSAYAGLIQAGENVLALHGLNVVPTSSDFLIDTELSASHVEVLTNEPPRFFFVPTPGTPNVAGTLDTRPLVLDVSNATATDAADVQVKARVVAGGSTVSHVNLHYRVMYGTEVIVAMFDDGLHGDTAANDGIFGGSIPAGASGPGQMVRYYVTATAASSAVGRAPLYSNPESTAQYLGFVIPDPSVASNLAIFQFFVQDPNWFRNANGTINRNVTSASFFFNGKFYDNIHINARGDTAITEAYPNQKFKVDFNDEAKFDYGDGREVTGSFNLDNVYQDPSYARLTLGSQLLRDIGTYAQVTEPVHARMNGAFYSLGIYNERYNGAFLRRNDLGDDGAMYEAEGLRDGWGYLRPDAGGLANTLGFEKDNREFEPGFDDLQAFINGISPSNPNREKYIFDNVNIPEVVNVIAGYSLLKHYDRDTHNYYVYRDSDGNGEWSVLPYDLDLIWDRLREPLYNTNYFSGHPFEGSSQDPTWAGTHWNRLIDAFADSPTLSQMVLRRLRELMDDYLQPPGTPYAERKLEAQLDTLFARLLPEAQLDLAKWGQKTSTSSGGPWPLGSGVAQLKQAFDLRRNYLYGLSIIPGPQTDNAAIQIYSYDVDPVSGNQNEEYIHLYNPNPFFVDLSGWKLESAVNYTFVKGVVIPAGGSLIVAKDVKAFRARTTGPSGGIGLFIQGDYSGNLSNAGETIVLVRANGTTASSVTYAPVTSPPILGALPNQVLVSGTPSAAIALPVSDQDTPTANLTFSGSAQSSLYLLDQQLNVSAPAVTNYPYAYYQNIRGVNEKYLFNPAGIN